MLLLNIIETALSDIRLYYSFHCYNTKYLHGNFNCHLHQMHMEGAREILCQFQFDTFLFTYKEDVVNYL